MTSTRMVLLLLAILMAGMVATAARDAAMAERPRVMAV